ncbi:GTPase activating protein [Blastomyces dermatitidis ER-3]|uniref:GTPase activating protein n=1 Tax=Ajellomyces dermatitidis (strain ER-3 / ATCC MYA-2586) TaxID=559297 RepID=A0ABP2F3S7_AJEDR|nr:GTPase activating protein [Blastomyces dermatitidis ER-3]EEQ91563.1 GTPase activating protein [Blastomyces dermatitidis ER-3]
MPSGDAPSPPQNKSSSSAFADVFKSLASGRPKSQSPVPHGNSIGDALPQEMEGRRGSRVTFGFESLHRGSGSAAPIPDPQEPPDYDALHKGISHEHPISSALEVAETASRSLHYFNADQALSLWEAGSYLIDCSTSADARKAGSNLLEAICRRQDLSLPARQILFHCISQSFQPDVIPAQVNALISLSDHGRKLDFTDKPVLLTIAAWIVPLYNAVASARSKLKKSKTARQNSTGLNDGILGDLFQLVVDIITLQRHPPSPEELGPLLDQIFIICKQTTAANDIKNSLSVFDAIIHTSDIPDPSLNGLLEVLCSIHASVKSLAGPTSRAVRNLAKSRKQSEMVSLLHAFLLETSERQDRNLNVTRGAVDIFRDLLAAYGQDGMPTISFDALIASLHSAAKRHDGRINTDILDVCLSMIQGEYTSTTLQHSWSDFIRLILICSQRVLDAHILPPSPDPAIMRQTSPQRAITVDDLQLNISANIGRILTAIESLWPKLDEQQRFNSSNLFSVAHSQLNPSQAHLYFEFCKTERLGYPERPEWIHFCRELVKIFILPQEKNMEVRMQALSTFEDAYTSSENAARLFHEEGFIQSLLVKFTEERSYHFLDALVSFLVKASKNCNEDTFRLLVETFGSHISKDEDIIEQISPLSAPAPSHSTSRPVSSTNGSEASLSNVAVIGLVRIFLRSLKDAPVNAGIIYEKLLEVAQSRSRQTDSRLTALKLLFRLRCDSAGAIYVTSATENEFLIAVLCRAIDLSSRTSVNDDSASERTSKTEENSPLNQGGRLSLKEPGSGSLSTSGVRTSTQLRTLKWTPPIWTYAEPRGLPEEPPSFASPHTVAYLNNHMTGQPDETRKIPLKINLWLETIISLFQQEKDWDVYSYVLAHLGPQLINRDLFQSAVPQIKLLRSVLCEQIKNESFLEPLGWTGVKKADIALCILDSLTMLISFHQHFAKSEQDEIVRTFIHGIGSWEGTSRGCIHALSVCCHEIPLSVTKALSPILDKMSKIITRSNIAVHILEFLALLARLPDVYVNLREQEIRPLFGICVRFIQTSRERYKSGDPLSFRSSSLPSRLSGGLKDLASNQPAESTESTQADDLSKYVYILTYHVMVFWFLSLKLQDRVNHVNWISKRLIFMDEHGNDVVDEQSQVFIDFMQRVTFSDLGDTIPFEKFPPSDSDGPVIKKSWIVGMSIVTIETAGASGLTQITKRQASGTTYATYQQRTAPVLPHQIPAHPGSHSLSDDRSSRTAIFPGHVLLQMTTTAMPMPTSMQPIPLPDDDFTRRAISSFDRNDIVDGHKIGVIYIGEGQTNEVEILANVAGSPDYDYFLSSLGTKVSLKDAKFNTQGLHSGDDGEFTYAWRDRVTEIIYHVATMMPTNLEADPQCVNKKRHIGNSFVNIIFNHSNLAFNFDTIPSQFNFVNIVISPASRISPTHRRDSEHEFTDTPDFSKTFYVVKVMTKSDFPELSPSAIPKVISCKNLASFVRIIALNASFYSLVSSRDSGEHLSSWHNRLREIRRLRDRASASASASQLAHGGVEGSTDGPGESGSYASYRRNTKPIIQPEEMTTYATGRPAPFSEWAPQPETSVFSSLDFSRWSR